MHEAGGENHPESRDHPEREEQTEFLPHHREDVIGMGLGEITQLLPPVAQTGALHPTGRKRRQTLAQLVGFVLAQELRHPPQPVGIMDDGDGEQGSHQQHRGKNEAPLRPGEEQQGPVRPRP